MSDFVGSDSGAASASTGLDAMLDALSARSGGQVVLATGQVWPFTPPGNLDLTVSDALLPPIQRARDAAPIQQATPLWVQVAIDS